MQPLGPKVNVFKTYPARRIQLLKENKNQTNTAIQIRSQTQLGKIRIQSLRFFLSVCVYTHGGQRPTFESVFSFHQVSFRDEIQVIRLGVKYLYPVSHITRPKIALQKLQAEEPRV